MAMDVKASSAGGTRGHTDMQRVVVPAQAEDNSLLGGCLLADDVVCFTVFGDGFALGRAGDKFGELLPSGLGSQVE